MTDDEFMRRLAEKRIEQGLNPSTGQPVDPWSEAIVMPKGREVYAIIIDRNTRVGDVMLALSRWILNRELSFTGEDYATMFLEACDSVEKAQKDGLL